LMGYAGYAGYSRMHCWIAIVSGAVGLILCLTILQMEGQSGYANETVERGILVNAYLRNEKLVVSIRNMGSTRVEASTIYLLGKKSIDYEMFVNRVVMPGETIELETGIRAPDQRGEYTVKVAFSNGATAECSLHR